jgi:diacylglycerol kinase family enzyme
MYYYIVNPSSGKGSVNQVQEKLKLRLRELGIDGEFAKTTGPGDAEKLTKTAIEKGANTIVAVGGDGTVNAVMNAASGQDVAVGIVPLGTSNTLAEHFGIHNWQQACEVLSARRITTYRLIAAGQNYFLSTLTLGFETDLDKAIDTDSNTLKDRLMQFASSWQHARNFTPLHCRIEADNDLVIEADAFTVSIDNQKFHNPLAENKLVISLVEQPSRPQLTHYLWQLLRGDHAIEDSATTRFTARKIVIETEPSTGIMIDGKLAGRTPIAIRLTDRQVRLITEKQLTNIKESL